MAVYWMCEVLPLAVTALMPIFLFPILSILTSDETCQNYLTDTNFLFVGGLIVAVAVEKCGLHARIALRVLTIVGSQPQWIMLGFMSVTAFLSMWISNTATTAMMIPIVQSVVTELLKIDKSATKLEADGIQIDQLSDKEKWMAKGLVLCICTAANIGGTGTVTGTASNIVAVGQLNDKLYPGRDTGINFASWMGFGVVPMIVSLLISWAFLSVFFLGWKTSIQCIMVPVDPYVQGFKCRKAAAEETGGGQKTSAYDAILAKYQQLPGWGFAEITVLVCFIILLFMWTLREETFGRWLNPIDPKSGQRVMYFTDATSAMIIAILLFALPDEKPDFMFCRKVTPEEFLIRPEMRAKKSIMDWETMQRKFAWNVVLLLGGGFALAEGVKESGLSNWIGGQLELLDYLPIFAIQFLCLLITIFVTNFTSNAVTASIFVPIVNSLALKLSINPLRLIIPVTLACSYAFALPVATPPNAIAFSSGLLHVRDMMGSGSILTLVALLAIIFYTNTFVSVVLHLNTIPSWALDGIANRTLAEEIATRRNITLLN